MEDNLKKMTEDEMLILDALVKSPAFSILLKLLNFEKSSIKQRLTQEVDINVIKQLQGRYAGVCVIENFPRLQLNIFHKSKQRSKNVKDS